jgi:thiamine-monophosphate kinase
MNIEKNFIDIFNKNLPRSKNQINKVYESDSEIITFEGKTICHNIDVFSEEDMLREENPYTLGWNIAIGCISDILASGGTPKFYSHSVSVSESWTEDYVNNFSQGISDVLNIMNISFIGGDFGISKIWNYTGAVYGTINKNIMLRSKAKINQSIYITGKIGKGNLEAAFKIYSDKLTINNILKKVKNKFKLRLKEANLIKKYSESCMDTSDGLYKCLNEISMQSKCGFLIYNIPYENSGILISKLINIPIEALFFGECGEYELLFTIEKNKEEDFLEESKINNLKFYKIGETKKSNLNILKSKGKEIDFQNYNINARDYSNRKDYIKEMTEFIKKF